MTTATAPAKVIVFGEHAVVYGQPAIAVPVASLRATASVAPNEPPGQGLRIVAEDLQQVLSLEGSAEAVDHALAITAHLVLQATQCPPPDVTITLHSDIPIASGLGSGAAVSTALARALSAALDRPLPHTALNVLIYEVEKLHHGTPSGIDNTVIVYEQPIYFVRSSPIDLLTIPQPFHLLIADTGQSALTHIAVTDVRRLYEADPQGIQATFEQIGALVQQARHAIETGAIRDLGPLMTQNHALLKQLTVSSPELDSLVAAALQAGALGAKLSGGGRGGNMIALVTLETREPVKAALLRAGAMRVFATTVR